MRPVRRALETPPGKWVGTFFTMMFITLTFVIFRSPSMPHALAMLESLVSFGGGCTMWELILKAGVLPITASYMAAWLVTELLKWKPDLLSTRLRDPVTGYVWPVKLASWTVAFILIVAARPVAAVPFVYFQF
jgi:hypothetical protein